MVYSTIVNIVNIVIIVNLVNIFIIVNIVLIANIDNALHYGLRAMGTLRLRVSELCLSFSPHLNIPDGNFNLVNHFSHASIPDK